MKRKGNLYNTICSLENLNLADSIARIGKGHKYGVKHHDKRRKENLLNLHRSLLDKNYRTSEYKAFKVFDAKERDVYSLPYYPDRIVHHAIMLQLRPILIASFTTDTYGSIEGRGPHRAIRKLGKALTDKSGTEYCLKLDIQKFYPSVDHSLLKAQLRRKFKDPDLLWLLDEIIDSAPGLPIGNYMSQYLSNFYLTEFDHWIKQEKHVKYYFRYVDDIVILASDKNSLHQLFFDIGCYMFTRLNLKIKSNYQVFPVESRGIDFLGYVSFHDHTLLRKSIKKRFAAAVASGASQQTIAAYWGWAKHCNSRNLMKKLLKQVT